MRESEISRDRARRILEVAGQADDYDPLGDYWVAENEDGGECLMQGGLEEPLCYNHANTSWLGSGLPTA